VRFVTGLGAWRSGDRREQASLVAEAPCQSYEAQLQQTLCEAQKGAEGHQIYHFFAVPPPKQGTLIGSCQITN